MVAPSPEPRRVALPRWLDLRLVLGVLLVLVAVVVGAAVVSRADSTKPSVTARHDLAAGTVLQAADLQVSQVQVPRGGKGVYLSRLSQAVGHTLGRDVSAGELVPAAAVTAPRAATTVTVPFAAGTAPDLRTGERITVWVSSDTCAGVVLLPDVTVQSVHRGADSLGDSGDGQNVVIDVAPQQAGRVIAALAIDGAQIRAGVLVGPTPSSSSAPAPAAVAGQLPADLAACASSSAGR